jgi:hypothetical protein
MVTLVPSNGACLIQNARTGRKGQRKKRQFDAMRQSQSMPTGMDTKSALGLSVQNSVVNS